jgi:hypothetical protein
MKSPHPNPLPVRRGEGEARRTPWDSLIQRQWGKPPRNHHLQKMFGLAGTFALPISGLLLG